MGMRTKETSKRGAKGGGIKGGATEVYYRLRGIKLAENGKEGGGSALNSKEASQTTKKQVSS